jgi:hypothetical protein
MSHSGGFDREVSLSVVQDSLTRFEATKPVGKPAKMREEREIVPVFLETLRSEVSKVKNRLQQQYEQVYPDLGDVIRYVIDEEEASAWNLSPSSPHLALPDLVKAHMALLGLQRFSNSSDNVLEPPVFTEIQEPPAQAFG